MKKPLGAIGSEIWIVHGNGVCRRVVYRGLLPRGDILFCEVYDNPRPFPDACSAFPPEQVFHIEDFAGVRNYINGIVTTAAGALASFNQEIRGEFVQTPRDPTPAPAAQVNRENFERFNIEKIDLFEIGTRLPQEVSLEIPVGAKILNIGTRAGGSDLTKIYGVFSYHSTFGEATEKERRSFRAFPCGEWNTSGGSEYVGSVTIAVKIPGCFENWDDYHIFSCK